MTSDAPPQDPFASTRISASHSLAPGALILEGRFRIEKLLGGGGMGLVYLAEQVSLGRRVAVKMLRNDTPIDAKMGDRFRREALLLSSVEHPAVVRVIEFGLAESGPCLVMELVEGETLEALLLRQAKLPVDRAERILTQLAQGLAAIHAKGIVHRDLKPDNVVLTKTADGSEQARLLDFGIARLAEPDEDSRVTQAGFVLGTPEYLAPEQALGQPVDARSDVYALGVVAFRMVTGKHPFPGPSAREFVAQHIHQEPPRLVDLAPELAQHRALVDTIVASMEKAPEKRPQTAVAFIEQLRASAAPMTFSGAMAIDPSESTTTNVNLQPTNRARLVVTLVVALVAATVLGAMWWNNPLRKARRLVDAGRGPEALQVIDDSGEQVAQTWPMRMLRAAALNQTGRQDEAWKLLEAVPENAEVEAEAMEAMADGFGRREEARLRRLLARFPKQKTLGPLQKLARSDGTWAQWGALRFIDVEYAGQGLPLSKLYEEALERKDCSIRRAAAKRLAELHAVESIDALKKLKGEPKKRGGLFGEDDCGQEAASQALNKLEKER